MSILNYFQLINSLPNPSGSLSQAISTEGIRLANAEVTETIEKSKKTKTRGKYNCYTDKERADIAKYSCRFGVVATCQHFSRKFKTPVSKTTVHSITKSYSEAAKRAREQKESVPSILPPKKRGRHLLLGKNLDQQVQLYLTKVREAGGVVTAAIVMAAAKGIVMAYDRSRLVEYGGYIKLNLSWVQSLLRRMDFVKRKGTTSKSKFNLLEFNERKAAFLEELLAIVEMEEIPPEMILNFDQTGIHIVPSSLWTMDKQGVKRVEIIGSNDERMITAVSCGSLIGDFLPLQIIYKGKTSRCHPRYKFPLDWNITHSARHWSTEDTMIEYLTEIIIPYIEAQRDRINNPNQAAVVIMDNFKGQVTTSVSNLLEENNIHSCLLPANTTDRLQPLDVSVNKAVKSFLRKKFDVWYAEEIRKQLGNEIRDSTGSCTLEPVDLNMPRMRELGAKWLLEMAEYISSNPDIIVNGFIRSGISTFLSGQNADEAGSEASSDDADHVGSDASSDDTDDELEEYSSDEDRYSFNTNDDYESLSE